MSTPGVASLPAASLVGACLPSFRCPFFAAACGPPASSSPAKTATKCSVARTFSQPLDRRAMRGICLRLAGVLRKKVSTYAWPRSSAPSLSNNPAACFA